MILEFFVLFIATAINAQKVKLKDVDVLTLYRNKLTNGRRSSPIQQLQCRGGTAGCSAFIPDVVQCYNRGSDGLDIQWECKSEMPVEFKFGKIQVSCEGYDYSDDPYILAGSCGLEYTIDRTSVNQKKSSYSGSSNNGYSSNGWNDGKSYKDNTEFNFATLIPILIVMLILYKAFFKPDDNSNGGQSPTNPDFIPPAGTTPPPTYESSQAPPYNAGQRQRSGSNNGGWNWGSFGAGFGAGSLFNSTQQRNNGYTRQRNRSRSPPSRSSSGSAGTRTASGFGGTSRR